MIELDSEPAGIFEVLCRFSDKREAGWVVWVCTFLLGHLKVHCFDLIDLLDHIGPDDAVF